MAESLLDKVERLCTIIETEQNKLGDYLNYGVNSNLPDELARVKYAPKIHDCLVKIREAKLELGEPTDQEDKLISEVREFLPTDVEVLRYTPNNYS